MLCLRETKFIANLPKTLEELGITKYALSSESRVRPETIADWTNGDVRQFNLETLEKVIDGLDSIAARKGIQKKYTVRDVFE